jgi:hypothetical protein
MSLQQAEYQFSVFYWQCQSAGKEQMPHQRRDPEMHEPDVVVLRIEV